MPQEMMFGMESDPMARIRELGQEFRSVIEEKGVSTLKELQDQIADCDAKVDEAIRIFLETMRAAFPDRRPMKMMAQLIDEHTDPPPVFRVLVERFSSTWDLVRVFEQGTGAEKVAARRELTRRGMI